MSASRPVDVNREPDGFSEHHHSWVSKNFGVEALSPQEDDVFTGHHTLSASVASAQSRSFSPIGREGSVRDLAASPRMSEGRSAVSISPEVGPTLDSHSRTNSRRPSWTGEAVPAFFSDSMDHAGQDDSDGMDHDAVQIPLQSSTQSARSGGWNNQQIQSGNSWQTSPSTGSDYGGGVGSVEHLSAGMEYMNVAGGGGRVNGNVPIRRHSTAEGLSGHSMQQQQQAQMPLLPMGPGGLGGLGLGHGQAGQMHGILPGQRAPGAPYPANMNPNLVFGGSGLAGFNNLSSLSGHGHPQLMSAGTNLHNSHSLGKAGNRKGSLQQCAVCGTSADLCPGHPAGVGVSAADLMQQQILSNRHLLASMQQNGAALLGQMPVADDLSTARETIQQQQALLQRQQQQLLAQQHQQLQQQQLQLQQQQMQLQQQQHQGGQSGGGRGGRTNRRASWAPGSSGQQGTGNADKTKDHKDKDNQKFSVDIERIKSGDNTQTTLMIKNIPNKYTPKTLLSSIDEDFACKYDFFYLPMDFKNKCNMGYAFINVIDPTTIIDLYNRFHGKKWEKFNSQKICQITYGRIQGQQPLIAHFKNSNLLSQKDEEFRPIVFVNGEKVSLDASYAFTQKDARKDRRSSSGRDDAEKPAEKSERSEDAE